MNLESSDARNKTAAAISSGCPIRRKGTAETNASTISLGACSQAAVLIGPGLTTFTLIRLLFNSTDHVRAKTQRAILLALETLIPSSALEEAAVPFIIIEPSSFIKLNAFCTVNK